MDADELKAVEHLHRAVLALRKARAAASASMTWWDEIDTVLADAEALERKMRSE